jgi:hypothetical protein
MHLWEGLRGRLINAGPYHTLRRTTVLWHWWTARLGRQRSDQTCVIVGGVKHPLFGTTAHRHTASSSTEIGAAMLESDV